MLASALLIIAVLSIHDGDTLTVNLPCDMAAVCAKMPVRINGIDTPELKDPRTDMKLLAQKAKSRLIDLTSSAHKVEMQVIGRDKYFRLDAELYSDGVSVAKTLVAEGLARPYKGAGQKPW
jgi:endonuclease YncB( thermonuclease family)